MTRSIAIVGSGPGGIYCAEALNKRLPEARIDVIDRLPVPYGLVRAGVAPDHQGTKAITRVFDRILQKPGIRFCGNVSVGRDVGFAELQAAYDAVVLATGAHVDRRLGIPGEALAGVHGSAAFVFWYNGHADFAATPVDLSAVASVAVIGNGNVAIDVARVLAKTADEMAKSDLADHAATAIRAAAVKDIHLIGRRGPVEASFTNAELAELGRLQRTVPLVDAADLPASVGEVEESQRKVKEANLATLRAFAANRPGEKPVRLHFHFHATPVALLGEGRVAGVRLARGGRQFDLPAELVVTCIGYGVGAALDLPSDAARGTFANQAGRVAPRLYAVGWAKRGPSGVIATNRADSFAVADLILADLAQSGDPPRPGPAALDELLQARGVRVVGFADWLKIDAAERAAALSGAPRRKIVERAAMLALLQ
ncbi:MAG TPA: FAD-dependent oxidoreductase [Candidatus Sulfotelmatobacter sp.]|nr:FAD-dependent oxidoreductase [Candidatus Sulfotelmatobacter sp.]